jgi:K+-sensing histidine kinase KdpD
VTTLIVLVCFALQIGVEFQSGMFIFFLLLPGIFLASVLFDRGSGFYATILSTTLCYAVLAPSDSWLLPPQYLLPFLLFVLVGLALATTSEAMRKLLEKAVAAEQSAEIMLYELNHRIRNNLSMVALLSCKNAQTTSQGNSPSRSPVAQSRWRALHTERGSEVGRHGLFQPAVVTRHSAAWALSSARFYVRMIAVAKTDRTLLHADIERMFLALKF